MIKPTITKSSAVGAKLKKYRKKMKLTQEALSAEIGIDRQLIARWETGYSCPSKLSMEVLRIKGIIK